MSIMHSIDSNGDKIVNPFKLNVNSEIFGTKDDKTLTNSALMYHDMLKYGRDRAGNNEGFRFSDLGNWLIANNREFSNYYTDSKKRTPPNVRLANNRQRIQKIIDIDQK